MSANKDKHVLTQTSMDEKSQKEIERLKDENELLQGKVKGYLDLSDLFREKKQECQKLKELNQKLTEQLKIDKDYSYTDKATSISLINLQNIQNGVEPGIELGNKKPSTTFGLDKGTINTSTVHTTDLFRSAPKSQISDQPIIENGVTYPPQSNYLYNYPKQRSLTSENNVSIMESSSQKEKSDKLSLEISQAKTSKSENLLEENLECDSLRIEENGYVHVSKPAGLVHQTSTNATYGSDSVSGSLNLIEFPSVGRHNVVPKSVSPDVCNPPTKFEASEVLQSLSVELVKSLQHNQAGNENGHLTTDGPTSPIEYLTNVIIPEIRKLEETVANDKRTISMLQQEINRYKETNKRQLDKIQRLEHQVNNLPEPNSLSSQTQVVGWEYIKKPDHKQPDHLSVEVSEAQKNEASANSDLEAEVKKLSEANGQWHLHVQQLHQNYREEIEKLNQIIKKFKEQDNRRQEDFDKILLTAKRRQNDEEMAKEDALGKLAQLTGQFEDLQRMYGEMEQALNDMTREKQDLVSEITALKLSNAEAVAAKSTRSGDHSTEITVLREQLKVFQEDFDRERNDRARAQSSKDDVMKQLDVCKKENLVLKQQLKGSENSMKTALNQNYILQKEVIDLKNQLRQEREANARPMQYQQPLQYPGAAAMGYNQGRNKPIQPETDPMGGPEAPYLFHQNNKQQYPAPANQQGSSQGGIRTFYAANRPQNAPELLPGAWNCAKCTYKNHPTRIICEICGAEKVEGNMVNGQYGSLQSAAELMPRGENNSPRLNEPDLSTDCGREHQCC